MNDLVTRYEKFWIFQNYRYYENMLRQEVRKSSNVYSTED